MCTGKRTLPVTVLPVSTVGQGYVPVIRGLRSQHIGQDALPCALPCSSHISEAEPPSQTGWAGWTDNNSGLNLYGLRFEVQTAVQTVETRVQTVVQTVEKTYAKSTDRQNREERVHHSKTISTVSGFWVRFLNGLYNRLYHGLYGLCDGLCVSIIMGRDVDAASAVAWLRRVTVFF